MRILRPSDSQWLFDQACLENTPSRDDGIPLNEELHARKQTILFMRSIWIRVRSALGDTDPNSTAAKGVITVGAALVHRFYMRRSLIDFDPQIIAPTMLFLASKIEEEPLRLRHIVNASLAKFEPGAQLWQPHHPPDQPPPLPYQRLEKKILATEELALETLCFDMSYEQPWTVLRRSIRGLDALWITSEMPESSAWAEERAASTEAAAAHLKVNAKGKSRATERNVIELGWTIMNESTLSPLSILHTAPILAFATFVLILAMVDQLPLSVALAAASELGSRFGLDIDLDLERGPTGQQEADLESARKAVKQLVEYCDAGLIDRNLLQYIVPEPAEKKLPVHYVRRFKILPKSPVDSTNGTANGKPVHGSQQSAGTIMNRPHESRPQVNRPHESGSQVTRPYAPGPQTSRPHGVQPLMNR